MVMSDRDATESSASTGSSSHADWLLGTTMVALAVVASAIADLSVVSWGSKLVGHGCHMWYHSGCYSSSLHGEGRFGMEDPLERKLPARRHPIWGENAPRVFGLLLLLIDAKGSCSQGILVTGLSYLARMWCIHRKGPVFATAFSPLLVVFSFLLHTLVLGGATHPPGKVRSNPSSPFDLTSPCSMPPLPPVFLQQRWSWRSRRIKGWRTEMRDIENRCCERGAHIKEGWGIMTSYCYFCC
ncbi:hypothetical protein BHM03_00044687 [Ensete ventricosum]|nr:hypothetical protein BHM03_00044687 [Ensete ventricosum]